MQKKYDKFIGSIQRVNKKVEQLINLISNLEKEYVKRKEIMPLIQEARKAQFWKGSFLTLALFIAFMIIISLLNR